MEPELGHTPRQEHGRAAVKIRVISDVHLESILVLGQETFDRREAAQIYVALGLLETIVPAEGEKILVVAGDLANVFSRHSTEVSELYTRALWKLKSVWAHVVLVAGNHDYWHRKKACPGVADIDALLEKLCSKIGVHFLQKRVIEIEGIRFAGCTLWSNASNKALMQTNDVGKAVDSPEEFRALHADHAAWLKRVLDMGIIDVVVTHYLPSFRCIAPRYRAKEYEALNLAFATGLDDLIQPPVQLFLHGHTHEEVHEVINGVPVHCVPSGYDMDRGSKPLKSGSYSVVPRANIREPNELATAAVDSFMHSLEHRTIHSEYDGSAALIEELAPDKDKDEQPAPVSVELTAVDIETIINILKLTFATSDDVDTVIEAKQLIKLFAPYAQQQE